MYKVEKLNICGLENIMNEWSDYKLKENQTMLRYPVNSSGLSLSELYKVSDNETRKNFLSKIEISLDIIADIRWWRTNEKKIPSR